MYAPVKLSIKEWAEDDRPREKLLLKGRSALSDAELIAILIGSGNRNESAVDLSKRILNTAENNLEKFSRMGISELKRFPGMGEAKALSILAALELGRRRNANITGEDSMKIRSSNDAYRIIRPDLEDLPHEEFWILVLNRPNTVIKKEIVSRGGMNATIVDPKIVFKIAVSNGACGLVLCHNHPSGAVKPSEQDIRLTKRLREAANILDIALLDHIIVGANTYFSFADEGLL
ncbi:MAG: DNA repair protein RadC [Bacteroidetes bacterium]|nr:DNA repair protein RadC [Bacteroidota bacterium]